MSTKQELPETVVVQPKERAAEYGRAMGEAVPRGTMISRHYIERIGKPRGMLVLDDSKSMREHLAQAHRVPGAMCGDRLPAVDDDASYWQQRRASRKLSMVTATGPSADPVVHRVPVGWGAGGRRRLRNATAASGGAPLVAAIFHIMDSRAATVSQQPARTTERMVESLHAIISERFASASGESGASASASASSVGAVYNLLDSLPPTVPPHVRDMVKGASADRRELTHGELRELLPHLAGVVGVQLATRRDADLSTRLVELGLVEETRANVVRDWLRARAARHRNTITVDDICYAIYKYGRRQ